MKKRRPLSLQHSATKQSDFVVSCFVRGTGALPDIKSPEATQMLNSKWQGIYCESIHNCIDAQVNMIG